MTDNVNRPDTFARVAKIAAREGLDELVAWPDFRRDWLAAHGTWLNLRAAASSVVTEN
jgi:hypothetical protein